MPLYPYQEKGVEHLLSMPFNKPHALLADAPGTGKTIMGIEAAKQSGCKHGVIICPPIVKEQWRRQAIDWQLCVEDEIQVLYGLSAQLNSAPWKILNYELARADAIKKQLAARSWHCLILDEAHRLKTHDSQQTKAVFHKSYGIAGKAFYKWALSGSIMPNRPVELYPILKCLAPEVIRPFDNWPAYIQHFCGGAAAMGRGASNIAELTERLQPFMLRRELKDVWRECPPIIENTVWLDVDWRSHPEMTAGYLPEATERRIVAESKAPQVVDYLKERLDLGIDKIVCFSYHRNVIELLANRLIQYNPVRIYGGVTPKQRLDSLAKFKSDATCKLFLAQIGSAGEGLDGLQQVCNELVMAEPEWSPGREDQAIDRLRRLGQSKPVIVTKLLASDSYEERIAGSNHRKRKVIEVVTKANGGNFIVSIESILEKIEKHLAKIADATANPILTATAAAPGPATLTTPTPAPVAPIQQTAPIAAVAATAASAPAAPSSFAPPAQPAMTREQFQQTVIAKKTPQGEAGMQEVNQLLQKFGVSRLSELPENQFQMFLGFLT